MNLIPTVYAYDLSTQYAFGHINSVTDILNLLTAPAFAIATLVVTIYLILGAFQYISSGGNKEAIASARTRITTGIVGLVLLLLMFILLKYIPEALGLGIKFI